MESKEPASLKTNASGPNSCLVAPEHNELAKSLPTMLHGFMYITLYIYNII